MQLLSNPRGLVECRWFVGGEVTVVNFSETLGVQYVYGARAKTKRSGVMRDTEEHFFIFPEGVLDSRYVILQYTLSPPNFPRWGALELDTGAPWLFIHNERTFRVGLDKAGISRHVDWMKIVQANHVPV